MNRPASPASGAVTAMYTIVGRRSRRGSTPFSSGASANHSWLTMPTVDRRRPSSVTIRGAWIGTSSRRPIVIACTARRGDAGRVNPLRAWAMIDQAVTAPADRLTRPRRITGLAGQPARHWYHAAVAAAEVVRTPTSAAGRASHPASAVARCRPARRTTPVPRTAANTTVVRTTCRWGTAVSWRRPSSTTAAPRQAIGGTTATTLTARSGESGLAVMCSRPSPSR